MRRRRLVMMVLFGALVVVTAAARLRFSGSAQIALRSFGNPPVSLPQQSPVEGKRVVVIYKAERALGLYVGGRLAATYPIALGPYPEGHKQAEGDGRTPEGNYYICSRNAQSAFHLFLGISYPNADDATAARQAGRITAEEHRAIVAAVAARRRPPWDTALGGEVGIHGGGVGLDWTLGCIAVDDEAVEHLWKVLRIGDPVIIR